jgi:hypothetical protein
LHGHGCAPGQSVSCNCRISSLRRAMTRLLAR